MRAAKSDGSFRLRCSHLTLIISYARWSAGDARYKWFAADRHASDVAKARSAKMQRHCLSNVKLERMMRWEGKATSRDVVNDTVISALLPGAIGASYPDTVLIRASGRAPTTTDTRCETYKFALR